MNHHPEFMFNPRCSRPTNRNPKRPGGCIKQVLLDLKRERDSNIIILEDFNTLLSSLGRSPRQKASKETSALNHVIEQVVRTDICRIFHPTAAEYTDFLLG
jgi:hypothetical protein